jgi:hypothetical protein
MNEQQEMLRRNGYNDFIGHTLRENGRCKCGASVWPHRGSAGAEASCLLVRPVSAFLPDTASSRFLGSKTASASPRSRIKRTRARSEPARGNG